MGVDYCSRSEEEMKKEEEEVEEEEEAVAAHKYDQSTLSGLRSWNHHFSTVSLSQHFKQCWSTETWSTSPE